MVTIYKAFLASPGDTKDEREIADKVIRDINTSIGEHHGFRIELLKWENNTYPAMGKDGQDVINTQIGLDYDIFIGVMWKRFGTPTLRADSGTEEEFNRAYERFEQNKDKKIMFYFNTSPLPQEDFSLDQYGKVIEFKEKLGKLGCYYWQYDKPSTFESDLRNHLIKVLLAENIAAPVANKQRTLLENSEPFLLEISDPFENYLNDTGANFAHSKVDTPLLDDLFVAPDLKELKSSIKNVSALTQNLEDYSESIDNNGIKFGLIGNDSSGKTSSLKYLFKKYFNAGLIPIHISGSEINNIRTDAITNIINDKIKSQYKTPFAHSTFPKERYLLIIDDFHKSSKGKGRYWATLLKNIEDLFIHIIFSGPHLMTIENVAKQDPFKNYTLFAILEFGPKNRALLINKWNTLGLDQKYIDKNDLYRKNDQTHSHIKTIIGKNYVPSYPFYLLAILQSLEATKNSNPNYSIHGFYYELIINDALNKAISDKRDISLFYNYLTYYCFYLFEQNKTSLSFNEFEDFHTAYCTKHDLTYQAAPLIKIFENARIFSINNKVSIKEKYVYYFFIAKYVSNNINKKVIKDLVTKMSLRIFKDEYASIIMFVTHLSKDEFIIDELVKNANSIFPEIKPARLQEDISIINDLILNIPEQVLELVDSESVRNEELMEEEKNERIEKEFEDESADDYDNFNLDDDVSSIDFFAKFTLAIKTIDILGQITKKYWGEIDGDQKLNLVTSTYNLGLRTLNFYLQLVQENTEEIIDSISTIIKEKHIKDRFDLKKEIEEVTKDFVFNLCFMVTWGLTKRVANSIGYDKLRNTFDKVLNNNPYNSIKLIDLAIKLSYSGLPMDTVNRYVNEMEKNKLSFITLQNLVIDHLYKFDTDYKTKDKICSTLKINVKQQLKIDATSTVKK